MTARVRPAAVLRLAAGTLMVLGAGCAGPIVVDLDPLLNLPDDNDGDGYHAALDCDDEDVSVNPGADEIPYDGVDQDCDGSDLEDVDGDGWTGTEVGGEDCDDVNDTIHPGAEEFCDDLDHDCDGHVHADADGDGHDLCDDCDDDDAFVHPGAPEVCDGEDNDCDGTLPDDEVDVDGDSYLACGGDCDDNNALVHPGMGEVPYDGLDNDCVDGDLQDVDGDGWTWDGLVPGGDCDDDDPDVYPGATEDNADGVDSDCDGLDDRPVGHNCYTDDNVIQLPGTEYGSLSYYNDKYNGPAGNDRIFDDVEFEAEAGVTVTVSVYEQEYYLDPYLYLLDPDCQVVAEDDNGGIDPEDPDDAQLVYEITVTGVWTIVVTTAGPWQTGEYTLEIM